MVIDSFIDSFRARAMVWRINGWLALACAVVHGAKWTAMGFTEAGHIVLNAILIFSMLRVTK